VVEAQSRYYTGIRLRNTVDVSAEIRTDLLLNTGPEEYRYANKLCDSVKSDRTVPTLWWNLLSLPPGERQCAPKVMVGFQNSVQCCRVF
jgi:hypothetical protein